MTPLGDFVIWVFLSLFLSVSAWTDGLELDCPVYFYYGHGWMGSAAKVSLSWMGMRPLRAWFGSICQSVIERTVFLVS